MNPVVKKHGLRLKLVWAALLVGVLPVILGLVLTYLKGTAELRKAIGANFAGLAREASDKTDLVIGHTLEEMIHLASSTEILGAVRESNRTYAGRTAAAVTQNLARRAADWEKARRDGRDAHAILSGRAGALLMKSAALKPGGSYAAIYAADSRGALAAAHNLLPPFLSGDRPAFRKA
ncbi:MAG TPA: hypothetical protein VI702_06360, partial [Nitrospiria bacterium]